MNVFNRTTEPPWALWLVRGRWAEWAESPNSPNSAQRPMLGLPRRLAARARALRR